MYQKKSATGLCQTYKSDKAKDKKKLFLKEGRSNLKKYGRLCSNLSSLAFIQN